MATDWGYVAYREGRENCRVVGLADNSAMLTALGNDVAYTDVFSGQLRALLRPGDVVVAVSASGNSPNILRGVELARERGAVTVGLVGFEGGRLKDLCDHVVHVKSAVGDYGPVEDIHLMINHILTAFLREPGGEA
jgi:D-sedoheptulose 7-phosphate isomerase